MSRINTNVSSLIAQNILSRSNQALEQSLERLSTGLRINRGKDDPSGLIASENLRSDIVSVRSAITNSDRANQIIATADSALSEVSGLLNDIRGLVTKSANTGALSDAQIEANQLQLDSSLEALNRISQTTSFQGRRLLDGSLDFLTTTGTNFSQITDLQIEQGSLGTTGQVSVDVTVTTAATQAQVDVAIPAATGGLTQDVVFQLSGADGAEVFEFETGALITELVNAINLQSDATGVQATANGTTLEFTSSAFGSNSFVDIQVLSEGTGGTFNTAIGEKARSTGLDIVASVNGVSANGNGNELSINTATLDLRLSAATGFTGSIGFDITGGGALFQLGPDVVGNQQARLGFHSVNTARLGGISGKLFELGTGKSASLTSDPSTAAKIVEEAVNQVTTLRGRLGALQKTVLDTNIRSLNDTLVNLTEAESKIRDADFASETAALTRAQILVQSGTTVLSIANSNPQNVLALLR